jgi:hypothetical protein
MHVSRHRRAWCAPAAFWRHTVGNVYNPYGFLMPAWPILRKFNISENAVELTISSAGKKILKFKKYSLKLWSCEQSTTKSLNLTQAYGAESYYR